uniref:Uncharacterized protein n=1 Tax=Arundo donax TaxID=35708 RepID=A0A0A8YQQ9_ARUDO
MRLIAPRYNKISEVIR